MGEPVSVALRRGELGVRFEKLGLDPNDFTPCRFQIARLNPAESIEQRAVTLGVEQPAIVVLPVDLDRERADIA